MELIVQMEHELIETLRILDSDRQKALLEFAKFLHSRQSSDLTDEAEPLSDRESMYPNKGPINLVDKGISKNQAADWRSRLNTFEDDWNHPDMAVYDEI